MYMRKFNAVQPARRARFVQFAKTGALLAPFTVTAALAQTSPIDSMTSSATGGAEKVQTAVGTIAGVVLVIGLLIWGALKLRPRG